MHTYRNDYNNPFSHQRSTACRYGFFDAHSSHSNVDLAIVIFYKNYVGFIFIYFYRAACNADAV